MTNVVSLKPIKWCVINIKDVMHLAWGSFNAAIWLKTQYKHKNIQLFFSDIKVCR